MRASCLRRSLFAAALALAIAAPARAELRISDLAVFLNDHEVVVHVVLFAAVPDAFQEGIQSGIPAHVRFTVELWQYNRSRARRGPCTSRGMSATPSASCPSCAASR
jgi:hypothetical protein